MAENRMLYRVTSADQHAPDGMVGRIFRERDRGATWKIQLFNRSTKNFYSLIARRIGPAPRFRKPELVQRHVARLVKRDDVLRARRELLKFYSKKDVYTWLRAPHKLLKGDRAIDLLGTDRAQEVWAVLNQMKSGAYS